MSWFDAALHLAGFLPDGETRALARMTPENRLTVDSKDQFTNGEVLARQAAPTDTVLTFVFSEPVDLVYVFSADHSNHMSSVDVFGGTPSGTAGIPLLPGVPQSFPMQCQTIKVYENAGGEVTVWGYRYG